MANIPVETAIAQLLLVLEETSDDAQGEVLIFVGAGDMVALHTETSPRQLALVFEGTENADRDMLFEVTDSMLHITKSLALKDAPIITQGCLLVKEPLPRAPRKYSKLKSGKVYYPPIMKRR